MSDWRVAVLNRFGEFSITARKEKARVAASNRKFIYGNHSTS